MAFTIGMKLTTVEAWMAYDGTLFADHHSADRWSANRCSGCSGKDPAVLTVVMVDELGKYWTAREAQTTVHKSYQDAVVAYVLDDLTSEERRFIAEHYRREFEQVKGAPND